MLPPTQRLSLAIGLPLRNQEELDALLQQLYDPASPNFHHYLTPEQFTARFGPTENDYQLLMDFAKSNGLRVTVTHPNRVVLDVEGTVVDIQKAFHTTLRTYRHPKEAREFYAPDVEPSVDVAVPILHISGLDNYSLPHPNFRIKPTDASTGATPQNGSGSGPGGNYRGGDFRNAYVPGTALNGAGQSVGLLQFDGFYPNDISTYASQSGQPNIALTVVPVDGGLSQPSTNVLGVSEVSLDIEMVMSMAPGLSRIYVFEAPNGSPWVDLLNVMVTYTNILQFSCSWGDPIPGRIDQTAERIFQQMAAQGQSFFNASGDTDAFSDGVPFPSESPYITQVGGTTLTTTNGGVYLSERVWNWGGGQGSSGGISTYYDIPYYQIGIGMLADQGSTAKRNVPDVALTADNVYVVHGNGRHSYGIGGTSVAAPLWAGFAALVNQQAAANGLAPVGFLNPALYVIGKSAAYTYAFHDITSGNNFWSLSANLFSAETGYDLCTGWGTPNGPSLINLLTRLNPWILRQPQNQTVNAGASATFGVMAAGKPPFNYQWAFNGKPISAATNASYSIARVQSIQAGTYTVVVSNPYGSASSDSVTLAINEGSGAFGVVGAPFLYQIPATIHPDRYSASALPPGLHFDPHGTIYGTPGRSGRYSVIVEAKNNYQSESATLIITIADGAITSATQAFGIVGLPFLYQIAADNFPNRYSVSALPPGLHFDPKGVIYGIPGRSGSNPVVVEAKNNYESESATLVITVVYSAIAHGAITGGAASQPTLSISRTGDGFLLTWPVTSDGFILEETQSQQKAWKNSSASVVIQENEARALVPIQSTAKFYRLRK
jgi:subtilase family serine protease